jgi:hypothetical protein
MRVVQVARWTMRAALVAAVGCGTPGTSTEHDAGPDASTGGGDSGDDGGLACGTCVEGAAAMWTGPLLLWVGSDQKDAPPCPVSAGNRSYEGYGGPQAPTDCGTCMCGSPSGSCTLPTTMTANAASCALTSGSTPHTSFDPSSGWTGACDSNEAIPSGKLCGGVDCVQSLTIGPLAVTESGCTPSQPPAQIPPTFTTFGRACSSQQWPSCPNSTADLCVSDPPSGFHVCIGFDSVADTPCPLVPGYPYQEKFVFYSGFDDTRSCSACTCDAPAGSTCSSKLSIYTDGACSDLAYSATVDATGPVCHDLPAGSPLGSTAASPPTYTAGACSPDGGVPSGAATPLMPATFCCLPMP